MEELNIVKKTKVDQENLIKELKADSDRFISLAGATADLSEMQKLVVKANSFMETAKKEVVIAGYAFSIEKMEEDGTHAEREFELAVEEHHEVPMNVKDVASTVQRWFAN